MNFNNIISRGAFIFLYNLAGGNMHTLLFVRRKLDAGHGIA